MRADTDAWLKGRKAWRKAAPGRGTRDNGASAGRVRAAEIPGNAAQKNIVHHRHV